MYGHESNKKVEEILVKEVRGTFWKQKWVKAEIKGMYGFPGDQDTEFALQVQYSGWGI